MGPWGRALGQEPRHKEDRLADADAGTAPTTSRAAKRRRRRRRLQQRLRRRQARAEALAVGDHLDRTAGGTRTPHHRSAGPGDGARGRTVSDRGARAAVAAPASTVPGADERRRVAAAVDRNVDSGRARAHHAEARTSGTVVPASPSAALAGPTTPAAHAVRTASGESATASDDAARRPTAEATHTDIATSAALRDGAASGVSAAKSYLAAATATSATDETSAPGREAASGAPATARAVGERGGAHGRSGAVPTFAPVDMNPVVSVCLIQS